jgi:hypothetical protein
MHELFTCESPFSSSDASIFIHGRQNMSFVKPASYCYANGYILG